MSICIRYLNGRNVYGSFDPTLEHDFFGNLFTRLVLELNVAPPKHYAPGIPRNRAHSPPSKGCFFRLRLRCVIFLSLLPDSRLGCFLIGFSICQYYSFLVQPLLGELNQIVSFDSRNGDVTDRTATNLKWGRVKG